MNTLELINRLHAETNLPKPFVREVVVMFFDEMARALERGDRVEIRGLFSLFVKEYEPYLGRNPKTKERVQIPGKKLPFFKCSRKLREQLNGNNLV